MGAGCGIKPHLKRREGFQNISSKATCGFEKFKRLKFSAGGNEELMLNGIVQRSLLPGLGRNNIPRVHQAVYKGIEKQLLTFQHW